MADEGVTRRDFIYVAAVGMGAVGAGLPVWPFVHQMNPSKDVLALSSIEVDVSALEEGQAIKPKWRGKPVFIRRRTADEIDAARAAKAADLIDPQPDEERVQEAEWLILVGVCTHLGCIPLGQKSADPKGEAVGAGVGVCDHSSDVGEGDGSTVPALVPPIGGSVGVTRAVSSETVGEGA